MIGIIDYGLGNLRSVQKAFETVGAQAVILRDPDDPPGFDNLDKLVLPGVGAFADAMRFLDQRGWIEPIRRFIVQGRPFLGICLGLQLLFEGSEEGAPDPDHLVPGLAILPGKVLRFRFAGPQRLKVPHMGWNSLSWHRPDPLLAGLDQGAAVYFVHSYHALPRESPDQPITSATADYGQPFTASIWHNNIWATQFHPEKSQRVGLKMLANFAAL